MNLLNLLNTIHRMNLIKLIHLLNLINLLNTMKRRSMMMMNKTTDNSGIKKRTPVFVALCTAALLLMGCNNFFHDLVPPSGDRITSFSVPNQSGVIIGENTVNAVVLPGTDIRSVIPSIGISPGATILPVTMDYIVRAFPNEPLFGGAMELYTSADLINKSIELIKAKSGFIRPALDLPIDFSRPVDMIVIAGAGQVRQYRVNVEVDSGEGKFLFFEFNKFHNPELVRNAPGTVDTGAKTVTLSVSYPEENIASYKLVPGFTTNGARVFLEGVEVLSEETELTFTKPPASAALADPAYGTQTKTLTLRRPGYADAVYTLIITFVEDPGTSRAITDFRFVKSLNPLISATAMATIVHSGDTGTIDVTVSYSGTRPAALIPSFVSPGNVTVEGVAQTSGFNSRDFSGPVFYKVVSRVGGYTRIYQVTVTLVEASDPRPVISSFVFTTAKNPALLSNSTALIDHEEGLILVEAAYDGDTPPASLTAEFAASGRVTVGGVEQTSGAGARIFPPLRSTP